MNRFVKSFYAGDMHELAERINQYAERNSLLIISLSMDNNMKGAIVVFEGKKNYKDCY